MAKTTKKRTAKPRAKKTQPKAHKQPRRSAAATWQALLGPLEALRDGEHAFRTETASSLQPRSAPSRTRAGAAGGGQVQALVGIVWTDPTYPIFYDIVVNGVRIDPPHSAIGGTEIREVTLIRGQTNQIDWIIQHHSQGWKNKVFAKFDGQVFQLGEGADQSSSDQDDISKGISDVPVS